MAEPLVFAATCGVTHMRRSAATKSALSSPLSAPEGEAALRARRMPLDHANGSRPLGMPIRQRVDEWLAGLAWAAYSEGRRPGLVGWVALAIGGTFAASIVVGGGLTLLMAGIARLITGDTQGSPHGYAWVVFIAPVIAFLGASPVARYVAYLLS